MNVRINHEELEQMGWTTILKDNNSFVTKTNEANEWLEMFYCLEKEMAHILTTKNDNNVIIRETLYNGNCSDIEQLKKIIKL
jgi:hypothetical protein